MAMEKYEFLGVVGEGSYGKVLKCKHKDTGQIVAIKRFIETEDNLIARKMALREIRILKKLRHENIVHLIAVFRKKKRFHLAFEYVEKTLLNALKVKSLDVKTSRKYIYQVVRGIHCCHENNIVHRDLKPENILISSNGVIKLCDFGFARSVGISNEPYTDYVATRWYRAPELLVGDPNYGRAVDIWAIGCILYEMHSGEPLFAGDSDIDQLYKVTEYLGPLTEKQRTLTMKAERLTQDTRAFKEFQDALQFKIDDGDDEGKFTSVVQKLLKSSPRLPRRTAEFIVDCVKLSPENRMTSGQLLNHIYFNYDMFAESFVPELLRTVEKEIKSNVLLQKELCQPLDSRRIFPNKIPSHTLMDWQISVGSDSSSMLQSSESSNTDDSYTRRGWQTISTIDDSRSSNRKGLLMYSPRNRLSSNDFPQLTSNSDQLQAIYQRNMIPRTENITIRNGKLDIYHKHSLSQMFIPKKPSCQDFCLPEIPEAVNDAKKRKQECAPLNEKFQRGF